MIKPFLIVLWRVRGNDPSDGLWFNAVEEFFKEKEPMRRCPCYPRSIIEVRTHQKVARR